MYLTWLDSNTWLLELAGKNILIDPWLVGNLVFGEQAWLFKGERRTPRQIPDRIDLILLSQGLEDHAHPPTLKQLDRNLPVVGSPSAAKVVRDLGYTQVTALEHGQSYTLADSVRIEAIPGSPIGPTLVENAYIIKDLTSGYAAYYEPHGFHAPVLKEKAPIDVVITPTMNLTLPLLGPIIKGMENAVQACEMMQPQVLLPTAAGGDVQFDGVLLWALKAEGSAEELRSQLAKKNLSTQLIEPTPGERFEVPLQPRTASVA